MADFTKNKSWAATQIIEDNSNTQITPTLGNTLLHSGNTGVLEFSDTLPDGTTEVVNVNLTAGVLTVARNQIVSVDHVVLVNQNGIVGTIKTAGTATSYNTSSDPRLKDFKGQPSDGEINVEFDKLFSCFDTFNWKNDPAGQLVWGFDAHLCIDAKLDMGSEGEGPRDHALGDVYDTTPAELDEDGNEIKPAIEHKVSPAGIDQAKAVPILLAKIEQQGRYMTALQIGLNDALSRLEAAGL